MFLPVLLVRDYGAWAWVVFAIPNVVGAAAMGWVLDARHSLSICQVHRPALTIFSTVTVAFQIFFAIWIFTRPPSQAMGYHWYLIGVALVALASSWRSRSRSIAAGVFVASIICWMGMFAHHEVQVNIHALMDTFTAAPPSGAIWLLPVCLFGFFFCPYLDSTFHRASQRLDRTASRWAFGVGFGCVFFAAIILSLLYARPVRNAIFNSPAQSSVLVWVKVYWMLQLGFTIGAHLLGDDHQENNSAHRRGLLIVVAGGVLAAVTLVLGAMLRMPGESIYRCFMGFYGLIFPAYVWLCMVPGRGITPPTARALVLFAVAVVIAMPMFWLAFLARQLPWGSAGVGIVLIAAIPLRNSKSQAQMMRETNVLV
jgi:hypothetical protein